MTRFTLFALAVTEVRDIFGASPELAARLREISDRQQAVTGDSEPRRGTLLGRIGPLLKRSIDPPTAPQRPVPPDVETLLSGRAVPPERTRFAWQIVTGWLTELSWGHLTLDLDAAGFEQVEFELARAGLPSQLSLGRLMAGDLQIPLRPLPGQIIGYAKHAQVTATGRGLSTVIGDLGPDTRQVVGELLRLLNEFPTWTEQAVAVGRRPPDLVVVSR